MCIFYAHMESIFVDLWMDTFQTNIVEYLQEDRDLQKETEVKEKKIRILALPTMLNWKREKEIQVLKYNTCNQNSF